MHPSPWYRGEGRAESGTVQGKCDSKGNGTIREVGTRKRNSTHAP